MTGEQGTRSEKRRGDGTRRDKTRQRVTEQEGTREEKTRGDGTRGGKRREERSCYTIPHTDKRSFRIHGSRGHFTRRQLTPRALNARVHSILLKKGVRVPGAFGSAATPAPPWGPGQGHPEATQAGPRAPKSHPRPPRTSQEPPRSREESPRGRQEGPRSPPEAPRSPPKPAKTMENLRVLRGFVKC